MGIKEKNSSIELLRIFAMFLIVLSHCCVHGMSGLVSTKVYNNIFLNIFTLGNLGVAIFVIITGYLSIDKKFKLKKIVDLELTVLFYSILFYLIVSFLDNKSIISFDLIKSIFPVLFEKYWFMTAYIMLYIFMPFLNKFIERLDKQEYKNLLLLCVTFVFIIPTITTCNLYFNELFEFISFYFVGGYIYKYFNIHSNKKSVKVSFISSSIFLVLSSSIIVLISQKFPFLLNFGTYFFYRSSIFILMLAISIFIYFMRINISYNKFINTIGSCTLGVYLIHDNPNFRNVLWNSIFNLKQYINSPYLVLVLIAFTILIFLICTFIELVRKKIFDKVNDRITNKLVIFINLIYNKIEEVFYEKENRDY